MADGRKRKYAANGARDIESISRGERGEALISTVTDGSRAVGAGDNLIGHGLQSSLMTRSARAGYCVVRLYLSIFSAAFAAALAPSPRAALQRSAGWQAGNPTGERRDMQTSIFAQRHRYRHLSNGIRVVIFSTLIALICVRGEERGWMEISAEGYI